MVSIRTIPARLKAVSYTASSPAMAPVWEATSTLTQRDKIFYLDVFGFMTQILEWIFPMTFPFSFSTSRIFARILRTEVFAGRSPKPIAPRNRQHVRISFEICLSKP
jgi:hypothetical protein